MKNFILIILLHYLFFALIAKEVFSTTSPIKNVSSNCEYYEYPSDNVIDRKLNSYYWKNPHMSCDFHLTFELTNSISVAKVRIISDKAGFKISTDTDDLYYTTIEEDEIFYIIIPSGFEYINVTFSGEGKIYEVLVEEISLNSVRLPFDYDAGGNMIFQSILLSGIKDSPVVLPETEEHAPLSGIETPENPKEDMFSSKENPVDLGTRFFVYPTPTERLINIEYKSLDSNELDPINLKLLSVNGAIVLETQMRSGNKTIDLNNFPTGLYVLEIYYKRNVLRKKIIKK